MLTTLSLLPIAGFFLLQQPTVLSLLFGVDFDGPLLKHYDYIICGCGISGLVVANRLSESPDVNVLCIEAGEAYVLGLSSISNHTLANSSVINLNPRYRFLSTSAATQTPANTIGILGPLLNPSSMEHPVLYLKAKHLEEVAL